MDKILTEWGFPDLIEKFQEHEVDEEALLYIKDDKIIQQLIPKIGTRLKFMIKLKNYQEMNTEVILKNVDASDNLPNNNSTNLKLDSSSGKIFDLIHSPSTSSGSSSDIDVVHNGNELKEAFITATKRKMAFCGESEFKKACRNVYDLDLRVFLDQSIPGKYILNTYQNEKHLTRKTRNQLSSLLINGVLSQNGAQLIPTDFEILSQKICDVFPTESKGTYYIPRVPGNKRIKPINAKGKLIDKYRNLKKIYKLCNSSETLHNDKSDIQTDILGINNSDLENEKLWLKAFEEPWDLVLEKWKKTFPLRKADKSSTIEQFKIDWPIIKHKDAYTLIDSDFQQLYPDCKVSLLTDYTVWEKFFKNLRKICNVDTPTDEFLSPLSTEINQDSKNAIQIAALPMLFPPTGRIRCQKVHWKPSIIECQESLINLVSTCANIQEFITKRRNKLNEYKLTVQPYIIVVGNSLSSITDSYLAIDNNIYRTYSLLHAIDFTFKVFHSLNANYPKESEHIWLILERVLYKIESSTISIPAVLTLIKDLEQC